MSAEPNLDRFNFTVCKIWHDALIEFFLFPQVWAVLALALIVVVSFAAHVVPPALFGSEIDKFLPIFEVGFLPYFHDLALRVRPPI